MINAIITQLMIARRYGKYLAIPPNEEPSGDDLIINPNYTPTYYISNGGNDNNNGLTPETAWASASKIESISLQPNDIVAFECGGVFSSQFTVNQSGTSGNPITIGAYGSGLRPRLYNSTRITDTWINHSGTIWKIPNSSEIFQLFVDDELMQVARNIKNNDYLSVTGNANHNQFSCTSLNTSEINYVGARISLRINPWTLATAFITAQNGNILTIDNDTFDDYIQIGTGFFIMNKIEFLTAPGEWVNDGSYLYLRLPNNADPNDYDVRISNIDSSIKVNQKQFIVFKDIEILQSKMKAIDIEYSANIEIDNCRIIYPSAFAISITNGNSNNISVTNTYIKGASYIGIQMWGASCTFENNRIEDVALLKNAGLIGIWGRAIDINGRGNIVRYNKIDNMGYIGIGMYKAPETIVEYNYITNTCIDLDDGGAIYMWEEDILNEGCSGTVIRGNIVSGCIGTNAGINDTSGDTAGFGIYLDDNIKGILVENNVTEDGGGSNIMLHNVEHCTVKNNLAFRAKRNLLINGETGGETEITGNTFYAVYRHSNYCVDEFRADVNFNNNKYISHYNATPLRTDGADYNLSTWIQKKGSDVGSAIDVSALPSGHSERMLYNATKTAKTFQLNGATVNDIDGNSITTDIVLQPFTGVIVTGTGLELID